MIRFASTESDRSTESQIIMPLSERIVSCPQVAHIWDTWRTDTIRESPIYRSELKTMIKASRSKIGDILSSMVDEGLLERIGGGRSTEYRVVRK